MDLRDLAVRVNLVVLLVRLALVNQKDRWHQLGRDLLGFQNLSLQYSLVVRLHPNNLLSLRFLLLQLVQRVR